MNKEIITFKHQNPYKLLKEKESMEKAKIITHELNVLSFQESIFSYKANFLCPVIVSPEGKLQTLQQFFDLQNTLLSQWGSYAGPAGIGQYTLKNKNSAGVLARWDINFRKPSHYEMGIDVDYWGEQVMGPLVNEVPENEKEKWKNNLTFKYFGKEIYFTAPDRIQEMTFLSRVFESDLPKDLTSLIQEVDNIATTDEHRIHQGYHFMYAIDGKIKYAAFREPKEYKESLLIDYGFVEGNNGTLTFYPCGNLQNPIDFTETIIKEKE
jgi:hypothetical protein